MHPIFVFCCALHFKRTRTPALALPLRPERRSQQTLRPHLRINGFGRLASKIATKVFALASSRAPVLMTHSLAGTFPTDGDERESKKHRAEGSATRRNAACNGCTSRRGGRKSTFVPRGAFFARTLAFDID